MKTIRSRLLFTFIAVILFTLGVTMAAYVIWLEKLLIQEKERQLGEQAASISQFTAIYVRRPENLPSAAAGLLQQFSAFYGNELAIYSVDGLLVATTAKNGGSNPADLTRIRSGSHIIRDHGVRHLTVLTPLGDPPAGYLLQAASLGETDAVVAATRHRLLYAVGIALLAASLVSLWLSNALTRPLLQVRDTALAIAGGNLDIRLSSTRHDELGELARTIDHMANEIQRSFSVSEGGRRRLTAILTNLSEGIVAFDHRRQVLLVNPSAARLFGKRSSEELIGCRAAALLPDGRFEPVIQAALDSGGLFTHEMDWPFQSGTTIRLTSAPLELETGRGLVFSLRNVTDLRLLEERRQEYISRLSHELRTPLTIIKGYLVTLLDTPPSELPSEHDTLVILDRETDRMGRMVEEFLEASRQRSTVLKLKTAPGRLDEVIREAVRVMHQSACRQGITIRTELPPKTPPVPMSPDHIKQVLLNLIENGIKYNRADGTVCISLEVLPDTLAVTVSDNGHGICPEELPFVFDRYFRGHDSGTHLGSGLGLAIAREIVGAHGGEITVGSSQSGTTVRFSLPRVGSTRIAVNES